MKSLSLVMALLCTYNFAFSQIQFGVKSFYSTSLSSATAKDYYPLDNSKKDNISFEKASPKMGIGISFFTANEKLFFMTDVQYTQSKRSFEIETTSYKDFGNNNISTYTTQEVDLRTNATIGLLHKNFKFGVGPEINFAVQRREELTTMKELSLERENPSMGANFLLGYRILKNIHIDLKYTFMFQSVSHEFYYMGVPLELKSNPKYIEVSLGFYM